MRKPDLATVHNGRMVHAWNRRSGIDVIVFDTATPGADATGTEWDMPKALGLELAALQAELQTDREPASTKESL